MNETGDAFINALFQNYNKNLRPNEHTNLTDEIGISLRIVSMSSVDIKNMEFTLTMYFRQFWTDRRLARPGTNKSLSLHYQSHRVWKPDTFFRNSKKGDRHMMTEPNILMRISPNGYITYSQKLTVTFSCLMRLQYFPMDNQACGVNIGSYSYNLDEVRLHWKTNTSLDVTVRSMIIKIESYVAIAAESHE